ncbi:MAG: efflux RND transporter permease subunit [Candidatus Delongbacteria bacterium]|nr:efflux RND transporter permease subunit [Candidatus Delongbacteria bacterium]
MRLSTISIHRPVLTIVLQLLIIIMGAISFTFLGVREYPNVDPPTINVSTTYTGANSDVIETQITEPLEESINGIDGIRSLSSTSAEGRSTITVEFDLSVDLEAAANDVRDRVSRATRSLPSDVDPPVVRKADANASTILLITLRSDKRNLLELTDIANTIFKERLQTIPGVSQIQIWGEKKYAMRLWLDPRKMAAHHVTMQDIRSGLRQENIDLPSGRIEGCYTELTLRTLGRLTTEEDFNQLIIREDNTHLIRLRDVGYAVLSPENERTVLRRNGIPMIGVGLVPQPGSNHIQIADQFYKRLEDIKRDIPKDVEIQNGYDFTRFIKNSVKEVEETILLAFILVILIIFLFLRDWRTTMIPIVAIPISLIGTFFIMYLFDFSINILTLLGVVLAIGIVVDDAIVVLENIYAKTEKGMNSIEAGEKGSSEIFFAIISTTATLASIFLPIMFLQGLTGRLFREFGIVLAGAILISAFVALTLTPMMSVLILSHKTGHSKFYLKTQPYFEWMTDRYRQFLEWNLERKWLAWSIMIGCGLLIAGLAFILPLELSPLEDRSSLRISATAPEGTSFQLMDRYILDLDQLIQDHIPERDVMISFTAPGFGGSGSVNSGSTRLMLTPPNQRSRSQQEIYQHLSSLTRRITDVRLIVGQELSVSTQRFGLPVQYVIQAQDIDRLRQILPEFMRRAGQDSTFNMVDVNLKFNKPELVVSIDRARARQMDLSVEDVAQTLQLAYSGQRFGYFIMNSKQYQIIAQIDPQLRSQPDDFQYLYVRNGSGQMVPITNLIRYESGSRPPQLYRYNRYVSATVSANLAEGKTIGDGIAGMDRIAGRVLDETFSTALAGASKDFVESSSSLLWTFLLSLVLIYLIMAAQFESFRSPLIIMVTVPLALAGSLFSLWLFHQTLNIFSEIGQIMLIGLVTKNGILIVEFANQQREAGLGVREAVVHAAVSRFRPILMTSLSTILGTLPIALALGAGSESRISMGIAVVGGMLFSTLLTLMVVPVMYIRFFSHSRRV